MRLLWKSGRKETSFFFWGGGEIKRYTDKQMETQAQIKTDRHRMSLCSGFKNPVHRAALNSAAAKRIGRECRVVSGAAK